MRKPFIIANWKMHKNVHESVAFAKAVQNEMPVDTEVGIAAQAISIYSMKKAIGNSPLQIIAQNSSTQTSGALTGEISIKDLANAGASYVILGHLERRLIFHESNKEISKKVATALKYGVTPIICTDEEKSIMRAAGEEHYVFRQLTEIIQQLTPAQMQQIVISYEPRWAVGSSQPAKPNLAEDGCRKIRQSIADIFGKPVAEQIRILYGGSVNPQNIYQIVSQPDVDGALIGRASLDINSFLQMINCFRQVNQPTLTAI